MEIRVFGADTCKKCNKLLVDLRENNIKYSFIDALADDTQDFCDKHNVNRLPHVQVLNENGTIVLNKSGTIVLSDIRKFIKK